MDHLRVHIHRFQLSDFKLKSVKNENNKNNHGENKRGRGGKDSKESWNLKKKQKNEEYEKRKESRNVLSSNTAAAASGKTLIKIGINKPS